MRTVKNLRETIANYPDDTQCYAIDGQIVVLRVFDDENVYPYAELKAGSYNEIDDNDKDNIHYS